MRDLQTEESSDSVNLTQHCRAPFHVSNPANLAQLFTKDRFSIAVQIVQHPLKPAELACVTITNTIKPSKIDYAAYVLPYLA
jgi:hypothetical protein